jgi:hypothetical protein
MTAKTVSALAAALIVALAAASAAEARKKPTRLWYRISLDVSEKKWYETDQLKHEVQSNWGVVSKGAVILKIVCVGRRTFILLANKPCARAYRRVHWRRFARNDLAFGATVSGIWSIYYIYNHNNGHPEPVQEGSKWVKCGPETDEHSLLAAPRFEGILASDSLVRAGLGISLETKARTAGLSWSTDTGNTCTYTTLDGQPLPSAVNPPHDSRMAFEGTPTIDNADEWLRVRASGVGGFGSSFGVQKTFRNPEGSFEQRETKITLGFKLCPRGGRAVRRC